MQSEEQIEAAARADAEYAGRTFDALSSADKTRFRERAKLMLEAALSAQVQDADEQRTETCQRCQGNGEIVTDWDRYRHPHENDVGDEAVAECPDCDGVGKVSAQVQYVAELDEKTIVRLAWENFSENDYGRLTYERAPPMFPQAKYDVPTYALSQFVKAVRAAAPAKQEGGE